MKINLKCFIMLATVFLSGSVVYAQRGGEVQYASPLDPSKKSTPIYIGPAAGLNIMGHSMDIPTYRNDELNLCPNFKNATGIGPYVGLTLERLFGEVATSSSGLIFRLLFNMYPGSITVSDNTYHMWDPNSNTYVQSSVDHVMDISYNAATFEVMYKINPVPAIGLGIVVGPAIDYIITKDRAQKTKIISPKNTQFSNLPNVASYEDNKRTAVWYDGEIEDASAIRFGIKAGVQYEILLGSKLYIAPCVAYNFGINSATTGKDSYTWRVSPIQIGIDARFAF